MTHRKHGHSHDLELIEANLVIALRRSKGAKKAKEGGRKTPRITVKLSCKKDHAPGFPKILNITVETISEFEARIEAGKAAYKLGFKPHECVEIELTKENF